MHGSHSYLSVYVFITRFSNVIKVYKVANSINTDNIKKFIISLIKFSSRAQILKYKENTLVDSVRGRYDNSMVGKYEKNLPFTQVSF